MLDLWKKIKNFFYSDLLLTNGITLTKDGVVYTIESLSDEEFKDLFNMTKEEWMHLSRQEDTCD